ncbi:MAG: hypothetical protein AB1646_08170 [Thermodesulfobacteriota bacterium]
MKKVFAVVAAVFFLAVSGTMFSNDAFARSNCNNKNVNCISNGKGKTGGCVINNSNKNHKVRNMNKTCNK